MRNTDDKRTLTVAGLIVLAVAAVFSARLYWFYHVYLNYELPFSAAETESLTVYDSRFTRKKEITRQEDIAELIDAVNGITVRSISGDLMSSPQAFTRTYLCFRLKDGSEFPGVFANGGFSDGSVQVSGEMGFDLWDYWDRMDYEVQENAEAELARVMTAFREELEQEE